MVPQRLSPKGGRRIGDSKAYAATHDGEMRLRECYKILTKPLDDVDRMTERNVGYQGSRQGFKQVQILEVGACDSVAKEDKPGS